jgi:protein gp37
MNKTEIEWTDFTWNPVTGCLHGCPYCYARGTAKRFYSPETVFDYHDVNVAVLMAAARARQQVYGS